MRVTGPVPLRDGAKIRLGDSELAVERRRDGERGGPHDRGPRERRRVPSRERRSSGMRPRVRSGYALKRLDASEGSRRWVLKDLETGTFLRLSDNDAQLFEQLDGDAQRSPT